jgi:ribose transport system ATP-binding protein
MDASAGNDTGSALRVRGLTKTFPGQRALDAVDFDVAVGEVHALVGQNGSGKSTLIKSLAGYHQPDEGTVEVAGVPLELGSPHASALAGLRFVHQDLALVPALDAVDNLALGRGYQRNALGSIRWRRERAVAREVLKDLGYDFDLRTPVAKLRAAERTAVAVARALQDYGAPPRVLVLDEPTASLPAAEVEQLYEVIRAVTRRGVAVVYISHHFNEVFEITERVTVLRDGRIVGTRTTAEIDEDQLVDLTIGRELRKLDTRPAVAKPEQEVVLRVSGLSGTVLAGIDFEVHAGEVVGVAGVTGSGREELAPLVFGALPRNGDVEVAGATIPSGRPDLSLRRSMALVPAERLANAALVDRTLTENTTLGHLEPYRTTAGLNRRAERADVLGWLDRVEVVPPSPDRMLGTLSGGNQQKVMLARALRRMPRVLLLDEPTQGVDVGAKAAIHAIVDRTAEAGAAVLIVATESEDLIRLCDRIVVLHEGRIRAVVSGAEITADELTQLTLTSSTVASPA